MIQALPCYDTWYDQWLFRLEESVITIWRYATRQPVKKKRLPLWLYIIKCCDNVKCSDDCVDELTTISSLTLMKSDQSESFILHPLQLVVSSRQAERWREASNRWWISKANRWRCCFSGIKTSKANACMKSSGRIQGKIAANAKILMPALHHYSTSKHN